MWYWAAAVSWACPSYRATEINESWKITGLFPSWLSSDSEKRKDNVIVFHKICLKFFVFILSTLHTRSSVVCCSEDFLIDRISTCALRRLITSQVLWFHGAWMPCGILPTFFSASLPLKLNFLWAAEEACVAGAIISEVISSAPDLMILCTGCPDAVSECFGEAAVR